MYCVSFYLIVIVCLSNTIAETWRDPHDMNLNIPKSPNGNQEIGVLTYYKRTLKLLTKHLSRNKQDHTKYDFNLLINAVDIDELIEAINSVDHDFKKLQRLDAVLCRVHAKEITIIDQAKDVILTWKEFIQMNLFSKEMSVVVFTMMLIMIVFCYKTLSRLTIVFILLYVLWAADFVVTWFNKYEDLEVDNMVTNSQFASSEPICDLTKLWFYERWFTSLSPTEECRRFYKARYKNKNYQIGPYDVVIEQLGKILKIFRFVAKESSQFLLLFTTHIPWPINWLVIILLIIMGFCIVQLVLFLLFGYSFKLNLAHLFHFEIRNDQQQPRQNDRNHRELIHELRQIPGRNIEVIRETPVVRNRRIVTNRPRNIRNPTVTPNARRNMDASSVITGANSGGVTIEEIFDRSKLRKTSNRSEGLLESAGRVADEEPRLVEDLSTGSESVELREESRKKGSDDGDFEFVMCGDGGTVKFAEID